VRLTVSLTGALTVGTVTPPAFDPDGERATGIHNAVDGTNRWDALRFEEIASFGYRTDDVSAAFFPGYPIAIREVDIASPFGAFGSAILVSNLSYLAALVVLYGLTARELDVPVARRAVVLLASFPTSFFFLAPYSESLFLLLTLLSFWWYRAGRWTIGGLAGAGASIVRSAGVLLVPALVAEALTQHGRSRRRAVTAALLPLLGPLAYGLYWLGRTGEMLQPFRAQGAWFRTFQWAPTTLWNAIRLGGQGIGDARGLYWTIDLLLTAIVLVSLVAGWRAIRTTYLVYVLATIVVVLSYPLPERPLLSAPRFLVVLFPAFWGMATVVRGRWMIPTVAAFGIGFVVLSSWFMNWGYIF
jgi:Gpi18-like mannosyltransferase